MCQRIRNDYGTECARDSEMIMLFLPHLNSDGLIFYNYFITIVAIKTADTTMKDQYSKSMPTTHVFCAQVRCKLEHKVN